MYLVKNRENEKLYKLEFNKLVNHDNIKDSYILWDLSLISIAGVENMTIVQYYFMESLETCLSEYGYTIEE